MRKRLSKLALAALLAVATALVGVSVTAEPASAASYTSCVQSPSDANCTGVQIGKGDLCWTGSYIVPASGAIIYPNVYGYHFETDLMYSPSCESNFSYTHLTSGSGICCSSSVPVSTKVRRYSGTDGPYVMEHGGWITVPYLAKAGDPGTYVLSPLVYSPHNAAQACISTQSNDQLDCTAAL